MPVGRFYAPPVGVQVPPPPIYDPNNFGGVEGTQEQQAFRRVLGAYAQIRGVLTTVGIRTTRVFVVNRVWQGGRRSADGGYVDQAIYQGSIMAQATGVGQMNTFSGLEIVPRPKCKLLSSREIFNSGGIYHEGDLFITYIQPWWITNGVQYGYTEQDIAPEPPQVDGVETIYRLQGSITGEYYRIGSILEKWGHYELRLRPRRTTPTKGKGDQPTIPFIPLAPIVFLSMAPTSGPTAGGTAISIGLTGFVNGATIVFVQGDAISTASYTITSSTSIQVTSPAGVVGPATITITNPHSVGVDAPTQFTYV